MAEREWKPQIRKVSAAGGNERQRLQAVHAMIRDKRFEEAHEELSQLIRENGKAFGPHFMMSVLYQRQRKFSEGLDSLKNALAIEPKNVQALIRAGQYSLFLDKDKSNNAEGYFSQALEVEPNNA